MALEALLGSIPGLLFGSIFSEPLKRGWSAVAQNLWEGRVRQIKGQWRSRYSYVGDDDKLITHNDKVVLDQLGVYASGKNGDSSGHVYKMQGRLRKDQIFSGTWKSVRHEVTYHGTFQLVVSVDGKSMTGKWLGNSNSGKIRAGEWVWEYEGPTPST